MNFDRLSRRRFLALAGMAGMGAALVPLPLLASLGDEAPVTVTLPSMGTFVSMTVRGLPEARAREAARAAFAEIARLEAILSRHRTDTPMSLLNAEKRVSGPPPELMEVAAGSLKFHGLTAGAFDPTVLPLLELFSQSPDHAPDKAALAHALALVDGGSLTVSPTRIALGSRGSSVTFDGLAKGYVADQASRLLAAHGATDHLVNAGGDIRAMAPQNGRPWRVAIEDPTRKGRRPAVALLRSGALATSGGYEQPLGPRASHLMDPVHGAAIAATASVTVHAPTAAEADALSTAFYVAGPKGTARLAADLPGREWLLADADGGVAASAGFPLR